MHEVHAMCRRQSVADLRHDVECIFERQLTRALDAIRQRLALDVLHHDQRLTFRDLDVVEHAHDIRVLDRRRRPRLALESFSELCVRRIRNHDLDGNRPLEAFIGRQPHLAHRAGTQQAMQPEAATDQHTFHSVSCCAL